MTRKSDGTGSPLDWVVRGGHADLLLEVIEQRMRKRRRRRMALASCGIAFVLAGFVFSQVGKWSAGSRSESSIMVVQAPERMTLQDGSIVELRPDARIRVEFTPQTRRLVLVSGQIHVQVTKNPERPFIVQVDDVGVRAVGTAFAVSREPGAVDVLVTEGRVAVDDAPTRDSGDSETRRRTIVTVDAGEHASVDMASPETEYKPQAEITRLAAVEVARRMSWRVPLLEFSNTPLAEALPLFATYGGIHLRPSSERMGDFRVSGIVRADNIAALLQLLELNYGIEAEHVSETEIVLRPAPGASS